MVNCGYDLAGQGVATLDLDGGLSTTGVRAEMFVVDPPSVSLNESNGVPATFSVKLSRQPSTTVTVPVSIAPAGDRVTTDTTSLTFTPDNYGTAQIVTLRTTKNSELDPGTFTAVLGAATSGDPYFSGADPNDVVINYVDASEPLDFSPRKNPEQQDFSVSEKGTTTKFYVSLNAVPTDAVTVTLKSSRPSEIVIALADDNAGDAGTLNFSDSVTLVFAQSTEVGQTKTVIARGVDDLNADGNQTVDITVDPIVSNDPRFKGKTATPLELINVDDDSPTVLVTASSVDTYEPSTAASFTVSLATKPIGTITIPLTNTNPQEGTISPASSLVFNQDNWSTGQTVTVTPIDDNITDGTVVYSIRLENAVAPQDSAYNGHFATTVTVNSHDNDTPSLVASPTSITTSETGSTAQIGVHLGTQPIGNVRVNATSSNVAEASVSPANLTFAPSNWNVTQYVTVTGVDDSKADGTQPYTVTLAVDPSNSVPSYAPNPTSPPTVIVNGNNLDNDVVQIVVVPSSTNISEGGSAALNISLASQPTGTVVVGVSTQASPTWRPAASLSAASLTFDSNTWNQAKSVMVSSPQDCSVGNYTVNASASIASGTTDMAYASASTQTVPFTVVNDDVITGNRITVSPTDLSLATKPATFTVAFATRPLDDVALPLTAVLTNKSISFTENGMFTTDVTVSKSGLTCPVVTISVNGTATDGTIHISPDSSTSDTDYQGVSPTPSDVQIIK